MVGIDIENIERFKNLSQHLIARVYTINEINYCQSRSNSHIHFAGIWCAKEAVVKALNDLSLTVSEIEILHKPSGAPYINITPKLQQYFESKNIKNIHISISHTDTVATSIAMIEK
ncbi:MAG: holo-ACP synthase [Clostridia bacterium]|nr:holo-ACP synthase [Clostridia bacterium]